MSARKLIAVASGKGGVGKSTVAVNLALALVGDGAKVGLLDADIYGPSIPTMLDLHGRPSVADKTIIPPEKFGIKVISMGMLTDADQPVVWRGPMLASVLTQFLEQVAWGDVDYLVLDLPPGTGDVQLTLCQRAPLTGAIIVTTPQDVALLDASRGLRMFQKVNVPILGLVENMSHFICDQCHKPHYLFGRGGGEKGADRYSIPLLAQLPIEAAIAEGGDRGEPILVAAPDSVSSRLYRELARRIRGLIESREKSAAEAAPFHLQWKQ